MRATLTVLLVLLLISGLAVAGDRHILKKPVAFDGSNGAEGTITDPYGPPLISNSPGEIVGTTYHAYQTNGSNGNRICVDANGGIHIAWTKGMAASSRPRYVYYNFKSEVDGTWLGETGISPSNGTGFVVLDLLEGGEALATYHFADATPSYTGIAKDLFRGFGIFEETAISNAGRAWIWPYAARNTTDGKIHVISNENTTPINVGYTVSADGGANWARYTQIASTDMISAIICTSPVSPKTSVVYTATAPGNTNLVDVFYFEATDGSNWNWSDPINITQFGPSATMSAWADVDALYDYDDNLHISYQGQEAISDGTIYIWGSIMHWSEDTDHSVVGTHPNTDTCSAVNYCTCISKMNLAVNPATNNLYAVWSDMSQNDVSQGGYSNGELYAAGSSDHGATWFEAINITNSHTPNCAPPDCDSDVWSSMAEKTLNGNLQIMYVDDNDAGAEFVPQGVYTLNNVLYLQVPEAELIPLSVRENPDLPFDFNLGQNYPNPFNANTVINVTGDFKTGTLAIYDVTGRVVNRFPISENNRTVTWNGTDVSGNAVSSGTYFYSVNVDGYGTAGVKKMTLLK